MVLSIIVSLSLTIIIELIVSLILGVRNKADIGIIILANVCTNPIVVYFANFLLLFDIKLMYNIGITILEISAVLVEYKIYKKYLKFDKISPFIISFVNNAVSYFSGVIINYLLF